MGNDPFVDFQHFMTLHVMSHLVFMSMSQYNPNISQTRRALHFAEAGARAGLHKGAAVGAGGPAAPARVLADGGAAARPRAGAHLPGKC